MSWRQIIEMTVWACKIQTNEQQIFLKTQQVGAADGTNHTEDGINYLSFRK